MFIYQLVTLSIRKRNSNEWKSYSTFPDMVERKQYIDGTKIVQLTFQRNGNSTSSFYGKEIVLISVFKCVMEINSLHNLNFLRYFKQMICIFQQMETDLLIMGIIDCQIVTNRRKENSTFAEKKQFIFKGFGKEIVLICE